MPLLQKTGCVKVYEQVYLFLKDLTVEGKTGKLQDSRIFLQ